ncbi:Oligopeptide transport ATP-binding protein OppF [Methanosarcina horonobensis HB-1 = JCM 15518]|uniref:Oligopeptide transport ATP-binding protein OppF n=1 Tax=Methanosarcina horonobensis HB-1 = JCM 15518 TaxID=1434110 RepID=A0A0E3SA56_9EURY|nr:dipeptide/oligopeptide/nickel ABC transporter ATP-binding protein [Methanosarcina horonobensis]AKB76527.1 Oligopeptide transport ATP-binding protein OppF [Methanosarcina horonobensis HB-1 = JCM 15518]
MNENELVRVANVTKVFRSKRLFKGSSSVTALDGVSLSVEKNRILGIIGESGSGKTTLAKLILGLLKPTSGVISFTDLKDGNSGLRKPEVQVIFQDPYDSLSHMMTIEEIVTEPYLIKHKSHCSADKVRSVLESVGLTPVDEYLHKYPRSLSGGQRQRVAVARAIITSPDIIIADEPISMLDASIGVDILNLILEMNEKLGITFIFITHDIAAAAYICDNIAVMKSGKIVEYGSRKQVIVECQNLYTSSLLSAAGADFIFSENKKHKAELAVKQIC